MKIHIAIATMKDLTFIRQPAAIEPTQAAAFQQRQSHLERKNKVISSKHFIFETTKIN